MTTTKSQAFWAIAAMLLALQVVLHADYWWYGPDFVPRMLETFLMRLAVACLASWGITTILFIFKK